MSQNSPADAVRTTSSGVARRAAARLIGRAGAMHGLAETVLIFVVLLGIEWVTPGPATLARIAPHPFWLPVILMSVQNGSASGLAAAGLATVLAWVAGWPAQTPQEDFYTYSLRVWREPILWIIGALVIGSLRNRQIRDRQALEERLRLVEEQRDTLGAFCTELQAELGDFERLRATAVHCPVETALDALHGLRHDEGDEQDRLRTLATCWLGEARWSLHLVQGGVLRRVAADADRADGETVPSLPLVRLYAAARGRARPLSVFEERDATLLDGHGVYACDVRSADRNTSLGLFLVASVAPDRLTPATGAALAILADAVGARLGRAQAPESFSVAYPERVEIVNRLAADVPRAVERLQEAATCAS